jgi:hypothetical protein
MKTRGGKSPDVADALLLTLMYDWAKTFKRKDYDPYNRRKKKKNKLRRDWRVV